MKIGMAYLWNAANGPSIHAELVGKAWETGERETLKVWQKLVSQKGRD